MAQTIVAPHTILTGEVAYITSTGDDLTIEYRADGGQTLQMRVSELPDLDCLPQPYDPITLILDAHGTVVLAILGVVILDRRNGEAKAA